MHKQVSWTLLSQSFAGPAELPEVKSSEHLFSSLTSAAESLYNCKEQVFGVKALF